MNSLVFLITIIALVQISMFCTELYIHRYIAHRSFWLHPVAAFCMHAWITIFLGLNVRKWAAVHRHHHSHADTELDPHSPHTKGFWQVFFGSFFYFNRAGRDATWVEQQTQDYKPDALDRIPLIGYRSITGALVLWLLFGPTGLLLAVFHLLGYLILFGLLNTLGHSNTHISNSKAGRAANVHWLSWFTAGESLHKNHHSNPTAAKFSTHKKEYDPGWWAIWLLTKFKLAKI